MFGSMKKYFSTHELGKFARFGLTGAVNTAVDFGIFFILDNVLGVSVYASQFISYSAATVNSYVINKRWTFRERGSYTGAEFTRFIVVNVCSLGVSLLCLRLFHDSMHLQKMVAKVIAACFTIPINFLGSRFWVFDEGSDVE